MSLTELLDCRILYIFQRIEGGAIVNMSSILGQVGFAGASAYVAAKHGIVGQPQKVAELIVWLCSPQASFITGAYIQLMGATWPLQD